MKSVYLIVLFIALFTLNSVNSLAQNVKIPSNLINQKSDTISKTIIDNSYLRVHYLLDYLPNPEKPDIRKEAETLLQIGHQTTRFMDYNQFRWDSIIDNSVKQELQFGQYQTALMNIVKKRKFLKNIIINRKNENIIYQESIVTEKYEYEEEMPEMKWILLKGDTIINTYQCSKAKIDFRGRTYIAWYAQELNLPYGPYIFSGLPGLIFKIQDTSNHYIFTINGLRKTQGNDPIYKWTGKKIINTDRKEARKIYRNYCANPIKAIMNSGGTIIISEKDQASVAPKPYNPIELE